MIVTLTKLQVAKIIKKAHKDGKLIRGVWIDNRAVDGFTWLNPQQPGAKVDKAVCVGCAVGSLFIYSARAKGGKIPVKVGGNAIGAAFTYELNGDALQRLSNKFEAAPTLDKGVNAAIAYALSDEFPDTVDIDIDGAEAANLDRILRGIKL